MLIASLRDNPAARARRVQVAALLIAMVAIVLIAVWYFSPAGKQSRGMKQAERHITTVLGPRLRADGRFPKVELFGYTGEGGSIGVRGEVTTWEDARSLRALVGENAPACPVYWGFLYVAESVEHEAPDPALLERVTGVGRGN